MRYRVSLALGAVMQGGSGPPFSMVGGAHLTFFLPNPVGAVHEPPLLFFTKNEKRKTKNAF